MINEYDIDPNDTIQIIGPNQAVEIIFSTNGKVFTVVFIKKDGSERMMNARLGVKKHLKGGERKYDPAMYDLIGVFDMQTGGYRMINKKTLEVLKFAGITYSIDQSM